MQQKKDPASSNVSPKPRSSAGEALPEIPEVAGQVKGRGPDRRHKDAGSPTGLDRRRGPGRRLSDFVKAAEEGEMTQEQFLFLMAVEAFKKANHKQFPSWTDVLEVVRLLGYRKTMPMELTLNNAEDWRETPNTPSNVRPERWHERAA
jgi:hypothetical protein